MLPILNVQIFLLLLNEFTVSILVLILYIRNFSHLHTCNINSATQAIRTLTPSVTKDLISKKKLCF